MTGRCQTVTKTDHTRHAFGAENRVLLRAEGTRAFPLRGKEERSKALRLWHGEDYEFTDREDVLTIANTCFEDKDPSEGEGSSNELADNQKKRDPPAHKK